MKIRGRGNARRIDWRERLVALPTDGQRIALQKFEDCAKSCLGR
jgi:hypothetical protein